jgi:hypothetical protein
MCGATDACSKRRALPLKGLDLSAGVSIPGLDTRKGKKDQFSFWEVKVVEAGER